MRLQFNDTAIARTESQQKCTEDLQHKQTFTSFPVTSMLEFNLISLFIIFMLLCFQDLLSREHQKQEIILIQMINFIFRQERKGRVLALSITFFPYIF